MADNDVVDQDDVDKLLAEAQGSAEGEENNEAGAAAEDLEKVAEAADDIANTAGAAALQAAKSAVGNIEFILDVPLAVTVEVGRARMTIQDLLQLGQGSVVELEKLAGEPLDIYISGKRVAVGEAVIINEKFGVRLQDIISPEERIEGLK